MRLTRALAVLAAVMFSLASQAQPTRPNIVYVLADDMGYGDVSCLNAKSKVKTPNLDRLASQGMTFTEAHSASAVCTPTRYGILTGRYPWRSHLKNGVLGGFSPHLIEPGRLTVAGFLKQNGYQTAAIGKWHLGMDWSATKKGPAGNPVTETVDYSKPITNGPTSVGFDYYYGIAASLDMPPYIWIENDRTIGLPTAKKKWIREGPAHPDFEAVDTLPSITAKAVDYIKSFAVGKDQGAGAAPNAGSLVGRTGPFFLYLPLNAPHTPILPSPEFKGKSGVSDYLDFVMQTDDTVGKVLAAIDAAGLADYTLVIFTADNGCSPAANIKQLNDAGHDPSAGRRGAKADIFDGGHRIPFLARWPGKVKPASRCDDVICLNDLFATAGEILGAKIPETAAEDSISFLSDLLGTAKAPVRQAIIHASINGSLAIRQGKWKLELCAGSGGWSAPHTPADLKGLVPTQLYDVVADPAETKNVQAENTEVVERLTALLQSYLDRGRSTSGADQKNDTPTKIRLGN